MNTNGQADRPLPHRLIYCRDGVGNGQFNDVYNEVADYERAWNELRNKHPHEQHPGKLEVIVVVANKDHHAALMPKDTKGNCLPGTVVDSGITSPYLHDFFLQSHSPPKGSAKMVHYTVLRDDTNMSAKDMHNFILKSSFVFARSTIGNSLVAPIQYAHLLAERGRLYLRPWIAPSQEMRESKTKEQVENDIRALWTRNANPAGPWRQNLNGVLFYL